MALASFHIKLLPTPLAPDVPVGNVIFWINLLLIEAEGAAVWTSVDSEDYDQDCNQCNHDDYNSKHILLFFTTIIAAYRRDRLKSESQSIIRLLGGELVLNILQEGRDARLEVFIGVLVEGELAGRRIVHLGIDPDAENAIVEIEVVQPLPVILPHDPLVIRLHLGLADGEVTVAIITAGIHDDALILLTEFKIEPFLEINRVGAGEAIKHDPFIGVSHMSHDILDLGYNELIKSILERNSCSFLKESWIGFPSTET